MRISATMKLTTCIIFTALLVCVWAQDAPRDENTAERGAVLDQSKDKHVRPRAPYQNNRRQSFRQKLWAQKERIRNALKECRQQHRNERKDKRAEMPAEPIKCVKAPCKPAIKIADKRAPCVKGSVVVAPKDPCVVKKPAEVVVIPEVPTLEKKAALAAEPAVVIPEVPTPKKKPAEQAEVNPAFVITVPEVQSAVNKPQNPQEPQVPVKAVVSEIRIN